MQTIIRTLKLKTKTDIAASDNHCRRLSQVENADPEKTRFNFEYSGFNSIQDEIIQKGLSLSERIEHIEAKRELITPRKDSVKCVEIVMAAPPELFRHKTPQQLSHLREESLIPGSNSPSGIPQDEQFEKWLYANYTFAKKHFANLNDYTNVVSMKVHLDETTPHIHIHVLPIHEGRYNCKHYLGGSLKMQALQDAYHSHMKNFVPQIEWERGQKKFITGKDHQSVKEWYQKLATIEKLGLSGEVDQLIEKGLQKARNQTSPQRQQAHATLSDIEQQSQQVKSDARKLNSAPDSEPPRSRGLGR